MNLELFTNTIEDYDKQVGEVFLTANGNIVLFCTLCECKYKRFEDYSDHVIEKHFLFHLLNDTDATAATEIYEDTTEHKNLSFELTEDFEVEENEFLTPPTNFGEIEKVNAELHPFPEKESLTILAIESNITKAKSKTKNKSIYKCPQCDFTTNTYANIAGHAERHTGKKKYCCTECGKAFYTSTELRIHSRIHTGERPYLCTGCGQKFVTSASLWRHNKICLNRRDKICTVCDMTFSDAITLRDHMTKIHNEEHLYKCSLCRAQFKSSKGLKNHMKTHDKKHSFNCQFCPATFYQQSSLCTHLKLKHSRTTSVTISVKKS